MRPAERHGALPLLVGLVVLVIGIVLGRTFQWSVGALWGVAVAATLAAGAVFAVLDARRGGKR